MRKSKNRYFYHIFVSPGDAPGAITLNVIWMEREFDGLAVCAHVTITVSQIERDIGRKASFFSYPLHSTPLLQGFPSEYHHPVWCGKTRMVWLPDGEKKFEDIFIRFGTTHERDRRTDGHRVTAYTALMHIIARYKLWQHVKPFSSNTKTSRTDGLTDRPTDRIAISISRVAINSHDAP